MKTIVLTTPKALQSYTRLFWLLATVLFVFSSYTPVYAQSGGTVICNLSPEDCAALDGPWANWAPNTTTNSGACTTGDTTSLVGPDNESKIWNYYRGKGLSPTAAAGIMGNYFQENSTFDPANKQNNTKKAIPPGGDGKTGFGIAQWTDAARQKILFGLIDTAGLSEYYGAGWGHPETDKSMPAEDIDALLLLELNFSWEGDTTKIKDIMQQLNNAPSEKGDDGSAVLFHNLYEGSADDAAGIKERVDSASEILAKFNTTSSTTGVADTSGCVGTLGGVSTIEDAIPWAKKFIEDTKAKYGSNSWGVPTVFSSPKSSGDMISLATWPENSVDACWGATGCDECVTASGWFVTAMTGYTFGNGNGDQVVGNLAAKGVPTGNKPQPFSIFSYNTGEYGHTGIVLGVLGDGNVITLENNWPSTPDATTSVRKYKITDISGVTFAYVGDKLKVNGINPVAI